MMRFNFTGPFEVNGLETKNPYIREGNTSKGIQYKSFNASIKNSSSRAYIEIFGMKNDVIKTIDTDGNKIEIPRSDIGKDSVKNTVASYKQHVVSLNGIRNIFIDEYDMIQFLVDNIDEIKGKKVTVTGQIQKNEYNGTVSNRFVIQNIYEAEEDAKCKLQVTAETFFGKDDIDLEDWADDKKVYVNGYTREFIGGAQKYVPQQFVFDASKVDFNNDKHIDLLKFKLKMLGCELDGDKVKCKLGKTMVSQMLLVNYINGSEVVELTEDMLTDIQRERINFGLAKLDDFRVGSVYGNRVTLFRIQDVDTRGKYDNGLIDTEIKRSEFEEEVYIPDSEEKAEDVLSGKSEVKNDNDENMEDLFA